MFIHRKAYRLYRQIKTKVLNLVVVSAMIASSLGSALPLFMAKHAYASGDSGGFIPNLSLKQGSSFLACGSSADAADGAVQLLWGTTNNNFAKVKVQVDSPLLGGFTDIGVFNYPITSTTLSEFGANGEGAYIYKVSVYHKADDSEPKASATCILNYQEAETPAVQACTTYGSVISTNLSAWDLTQSSNDGSAHNELAAGGLHIWTEATGHRKAAGYYATDFPLSGLGAQTIAESIDYQATSGITPGLQLVIDFDHDGTPDGILVGESVYNNSWWLSTGSAQFVKDNAPNTGGGNGSDWFGTPNEWLSAFPTAQVKAIGYSLGSGVTADGIIKRITLGCVNYTFDLPAPVDTVPPTATFVFPTPSGTSVKTFQVQFSEAVEADEAENATNYILNNWPGEWSGNAGGNANVDYDPDTYVATVTFTADGWYLSPEQQWGVQNVDDLAGNLLSPNPTTAYSTPMVAPIMNGVPTTSSPTSSHSPVWTWPAATDPGIVGGTASGIKHYEYALTSAGGTPTTWTSTAATSATTPVAADGAYDLHVRPVDKAGNTGAATVGTVVVDSINPVVTITNVTVSADKKLSFDLKATDENSGLLHVAANIYNESNTGSPLISLGSGNPTRLNVPHSGLPAATPLFETTLNNIDVSGLATGTYTIRAFARDHAGNEHRFLLVQFTVDNTAPSVPTITFPSAEQYFNSQPILNQWTASSDVSGIATYQIAYNYDDGHAFGASTCPDLTMVGYSGFIGCRDLTATQRNHMPALSEQGGVTIWVRAQDNAGNWSAWSVPVHYTYDATDPFVEITGYGQSGNQIQPDVTATDPSTPLVYAWTTDPSNPGAVAFNHDVLNPVFTVTAEGDYAFELTVTDAAGNSTTVPFTFTYTELEDEEQPFTNVATTDDGNPPLTDDGQGVNDPLQTPQVLSTSTSEPADSSDVEDASTTLVENAASTKGKFLGLGWWWAAILGALALFWLLFFARRRTSED